MSGTCWGLKFDFIIIHDSGHEWFANNITYKDIADMWIHESFTAYSENLYLDYHFGKKAAADYVIGTRMAIGNKKPIIGPYDVNHAGSGDMYYKGANMLHMIRTILNDDEKWRMILRGLNETFYHKTVTTEEIEQYLIAHTGLDLSSIFDQYLRNIEIPKLEYYIDKASAKMYYRWNNCIDDFHMPVRIYADDNERDLVPSTEWKFIELPPNTPEEWEVDRNYYVDIDHLKRM